MVTDILKIHMVAFRISIHTTAKVVTIQLLGLGHTDPISIHTTAKVVTWSEVSKWMSKSISIHTTAKVVTSRTAYAHNL